MAPDKRRFPLSFSVKVDMRRVRFEASPAILYGGPAGLYRVRADRRWQDTPEGDPRYLDRAGLAALVVDTALGTLEEPAPAPVIPYPSRVSVCVWQNGEPHYEGGWTASPVIRAYDGRWMVAVSIYGGVRFVPTDTVFISKRGRHEQAKGTFRLIS